MGRRSGSGKGGMQSAGLDYSIVCPQCQKPAARREADLNVEFSDISILQKRAASGMK